MNSSREELLVEGGAGSGGARLAECGSTTGGTRSSTGVISRMMIFRPPWWWVSVCRTSSAGTMNAGFGGSMGGGVPSGILPRTWAVVGEVSSWAKTNAVPAIAARKMSGIGFMRKDCLK